MMRNLVTPVPIPNTTVKQITADGTARAAVWESKWLPGSLWLTSEVTIFRGSSMVEHSAVNR